MNKRNRLPNRRPSVTRKITWDQHRFYVTIGFDPKTGDTREVFYADGQRTGSQLQHAIQDACVLVSLLLQHGMSPDQIGKSLSTAPVMGEERPASVIGTIVTVIQEERPDSPSTLSEQSSKA